MKKGTPMLMMATGAQADVVEVGTFGAGQFIPCDELSAGMVGYITASLKNVHETRVGDTITNAERPCDEPLPGYKKVNPMVYCGMYPSDGAKYPDLRDALEKLQLNDAALQFEQRHQLRWDSDFAADSLGCFIWKSSRKDWRGNMAWIWLLPHPVLFIRYTKRTERSWI